MTHFALRNSVAFIRLIRPPLNTLNLDVRSGILDSLMRSVKEQAKAVILYGEGKSFSAGADITELARGRHNISPHLNQVISTLDAFPKPVIACIRGFALGGGFETALACHYRIASADAKFAFPEVSLGILPGAGGTNSHLQPNTILP